MSILFSKVCYVPPASEKGGVRPSFPMLKKIVLVPNSPLYYLYFILN